MATITAASAAATVPVYQPPAATVAAKVGTIEATTGNLALNNIIEMVRVPPGATVLGVDLITDDLDSNGTPLIKLDVGDSDDPDYYVAANTVAQAGGRVEASAATAFPKTYAAEATINVKIQTAAATVQAGTITLVVYYLGE